MRAFVESLVAVVWTVGLAALVGYGFFLGVSFVSGEELRRTLILLGVSGALGGLLYSIIASKGEFGLCYYKKEGSERLTLGALGDMVVGIGGALGVFFVLAGTIKLDAAADNVLRVLGLGVVSGYGARRLMKAMEERLSQALAQQAAEESKKAREEIQGERAQHSVREGIDFLSRNDYIAALQAFGEAIKLDPSYAQPHVGQGMVFKRQGKYGDAVKACTTAIEKDRELAVAWYNRSCYRALNGEGVNAVLADLREAVRLNAFYRGEAKMDADFDLVCKEKAFTDFLATAEG